MKPNSETGMGGALDLAPPPETDTAAPKPMRLNAVERPRRVVDRAPRPQPRDERRRNAAAQAEAAPSAPDPLPDPLDEALPPRIVDAEPVNAMQLPPPKTDDRIVGSN